MAGRDPWTMRNGGILGGLFPDADQDLAFRYLAPLGEPAWAQATRDLMARSAQGSSAARDYPIPSQPAPWFPSALSATNTLPAQPQPTTAAYLNSQARGPSWLGDSSGNPPPLLHELPYFAMGLNSSPRQTDTSQGNLGRFSFAGENHLSRTIPATPSAPVVPAGFRGGISIPYPGFAPALPDLDIEKWWDHTKRGHNGLWNYLRSFTGSGGGNDHSEDKCDVQYEEDSEICRGARSRTCWEQAASRLGECIAGRPIPPLGFGGR